MARAMAPKKKERDPKTEDVFVERLLEAGTWVQHNVRTVVAIVVVAGLVAAGTVYYLDYRESLTAQAAVELQQITGSLAGLETGEAAGRLQAYIERFDGTRSADEARLTLARMQLQFGQPAAALETLAAVTDGSVEAPLGYGAAVLRASAQEAEGRIGAALETLATVANRARHGFQRRAASAERARLLIQQGSLAEAEAIYAELVAETEEAAPAEAADYRVRLGEVRALRAGGGGAAASGAEAASTEPGGEAAGGDDSGETGATEDGAGSADAPPPEAPGR